VVSNEEEAISSYHKSEDHKTCKVCGYYGCEGQCVVEPCEQLKEEEITDKGQEFLTNDAGLIDICKTQELFQKRQMNGLSIKPSDEKPPLAKP